MGFLQRKKLDIRVPTGRDAVNFRKLLFLPIKDTEDLLSSKEWDCVRLYVHFHGCHNTAVSMTLYYYCVFDR